MPLVPFSGSGTTAVTLAPASAGAKNRILGVAISSVGTTGRVTLKSGTTTVIPVEVNKTCEVHPRDTFNFATLVAANEAITIVASDAGTAFAGHFEYRVDR